MKCFQKEENLKIWSHAYTCFFVNSQKKFSYGEGTKYHGKIFFSFFGFMLMKMIQLSILKVDYKQIQFSPLSHHVGQTINLFEMTLNGYIWQRLTFTQKINFGAMQWHVT